MIDFLINFAEDRKPRRFLLGQPLKLTRLCMYVILFILMKDGCIKYIGCR